MEKFQKLDSFHIKIFAIIFMIIDHLGLFFFKDVIILRYIGRASFILFAFLCAESMHYGKHKERYIISFYAFEIIYSLIEYIFTKQYTSSIFITLALGSTTIYFLQKQKPYLKLLAILPIMYAIFASFNYTKINVLYGIYGVLIIVGFYLVRLFLKKYYQAFFFDDEIEKTTIFHKAYVIVCALFVLSISLLVYFFSHEISSIFPSGNMDYYAQSYAIIAIPFILLYSSKRGKDNKYLRIAFYISYPLNIAIFYVIGLFL